MIPLQDSLGTISSALEQRGCESLGYWFVHVLPGRHAASLQISPIKTIVVNLRCFFANKKRIPTPGRWQASELQP
jgi:hypothetical protein